MLQRRGRVRRREQERRRQEGGCGRENKMKRTNRYAAHLVIGTAPEVCNGGRRPEVRVGRKIGKSREQLRPLLMDQADQDTHARTCTHTHTHAHTHTRTRTRTCPAHYGRTYPGFGTTAT